MKAHEIRSKVQANARACEATLQELDEKCQAANTERKALAAHLECKVIELADIHISQANPLVDEAARQLELRSHEEQSMRDQLHRVEASIAERLAAFESLNQQMDVCEKVATSLLAKNEQFALRQAQYEADQVNVERHRSEMSEIQAECTRKLPAYRTSRLYTYLKSVGYGTAQYDAPRLFRLADAWVAKLCTFRQNSAAESMLQAMHAEATKRIDEGAVKLDEHRLWLTEQRNAAAAASGCTDVRKNIDAQRRLLAEQQARIPAMKEALTEYAERRDFRYIRARDLIVRELMNYDAAALASKVSAIGTALSDSDVRTITSLRAALQRHDDDHAALFNQRHQAETASTRAQVIQRELRSERYVSSRHAYNSGLDFDSLLTGYMLGQYDSGDVSRKLISHQEAVEVVPSREWSTVPDVTPRFSAKSSSSGSTYSSSSRSDDDDRDSYTRSSGSRSSYSSSSDDSSSGSSYSSSSSSDGGSYSSSDSF